MNEAQQKQLLEQLRDIHLPEPISWWPLAPGWWLAALVFIVLLTFSIYKFIKVIKKNRYRKVASLELEHNYQQWQSDNSNSHYIESANKVLRRCIQHLTNNTSLTSNSGQQWAETLSKFSKTPLSDDTNLALSEACYQANPDVDIQQLHSELSSWLKSHKGVTNA